MYRMFKTASIQRNNVHLFLPVRPCSLCNRTNSSCDVSKPFINNLLYRNSTTTTGEQTNIKKPKRKFKTKKKYAELVEMNDHRAKLTKAVVKKLSAYDVSKLSQQPDLSLEQFHHILKQTKTKPLKVSKKTSEDYDHELRNFKNSDDADWDLLHHDAERVAMYPKEDLLFRDVSSPSLHENLQSFSTCEQESEETDALSAIEEEEEKENLSERQSKGLGEKSKNRRRVTSLSTDLTEFVKKASRNPLDDRKREKNVQLNKSLRSYVELCVQCDLLNVAFGTLSRYARLHVLGVKSQSINGPGAFNLLLHGFASKANIDKMMVLMSMMDKCNIRFTPQTYAACFECFGRLPQTPDNEKMLRIINEQLEAHEYSFDSLMNKCKYSRDQRDQVLKSIRVLNPDYVWNYKPQSRDYSAPILKDLNADHTPYRSPASELFKDQQINEMMNEQLKVESDSSLKVNSAVKPEIVTSKMKFYRKKWDQLTRIWQKTLREGFVKNLNNLETQLSVTKSCYGVNIYPYLRILTTEQYVEIMLNEISKLLMGSETYSGSLRSLHKDLGKQVQLRYDIKVKEQSGLVNKLDKIYRKYIYWYLHPETNLTSHNTRHEWQRLCDEMVAHGPNMEFTYEKWPIQIQTDVGKFLYAVMLEHAKFDANCLKQNAPPMLQYAFYSLYRYQSQRLALEIRPNSQMYKLYRDTQPEEINFNIDTLPMVSPPRPWTSIMSGGYCLAENEFIRFMNGGTVNSFNPNKFVPVQQLNGVFDSLNQLSAVPWKINEPILDLMLKLFRDGGSSELKIPLSVGKFMEKQLPDPAKKLSFQERFRLHRRKAETYSLWAESLYRLSLANHYRNRIFWFPHNLDFRGRVYPIPPHLTHLGSDLARALLIFGKGEKLGPRGLDWLKIHCVNLTGLKKRESLSERLKYADEILPEILDSAEKPLTGNMWWARSDEIWQTLACCMEIKSALDSGDPENYICYFPVHQDGSCNGLQHYAALGRDEMGGRSVNLTPCDTPQDVYSCVVEEVEKRRVQDAENGKSIAIALEGHIKRKVIKQTVMTTVYGVTLFGARLQIAKQLKASPDLPITMIWPGSNYLVSSTFACLRNMFTSTKLIQDWFVDCARHISKDEKEFIRWETPLGLVAMQPYAKIKNSSGSEEKTSNVLVPHVMKQKNAFPPNYIHSLDSSHMMLTSLFTEREGITFVSVHDCFWTHPSNVETLNKVCREQFVKLHSLPLLEDLSTYLITNFATESMNENLTVLSKVPRKGSLVLEDILRSTYFFS